MSALIGFNDPEQHHLAAPLGPQDQLPNFSSALLLQILPGLGCMGTFLQHCLLDGPCLCAVRSLSPGSDVFCSLSQALSLSLALVAPMGFPERILDLVHCLPCWKLFMDHPSTLSTVPQFLQFRKDFLLTFF